MKVIWTQGAEDDLREIVNFISLDSRAAAQRVAAVVYNRTSSLATMPYRGRKRVDDDALELSFTPWPYVAVYEVIDGEVFIEGIRHTSRDSLAAL